MTEKDPFSEVWQWKVVAPRTAAGEIRPWMVPLSDIDQARFLRLCNTIREAYGNPAPLIPGAKTSRSWHK